MRAVTRPLSAYVDTPVDLNDIAGGDGVLFVRNAVGVAGRGVAATVPVDEASAFLAAVDHDSTVSGSGPVAIGCVPFLPGAPADLVIPTIQFRKNATGETSVTVVGDAMDIGNISELVQKHSSSGNRHPPPRRAGRSNRASRPTRTWRQWRRRVTRCGQAN
jgi:hypothetical protein